MTHELRRPRKTKAAVDTPGRLCLDFFDQALIAFTLHPLAHQLAHPAGRFGGLTGTAL